MKTLFFESESGNISGFCEYFWQSGEIVLNYNIKQKKDFKNILKIYALSSKKPFNTPIIVDTLEFSSGTAASGRRISSSGLIENGYRKDDIDTFAVVKISASGKKESIEGVCFGENAWDIEGAFFEKNTEIASVKDPAERGREVLEEIKERTKTKDPAMQKVWLDILKEESEKLQVSEISLSENYKWYKIDKIRPPIALSGYRHLLYVTEIMTAFETSGEYLFGINGSHTALAIKCSSFNPFVNANDCTAKIGEYYAVGLYLAPDGQYFEKPH